MQSPENKDADLVFAAIRLKVCPLNYDSTSTMHEISDAYKQKVTEIAVIVLI